MPASAPHSPAADPRAPAAGRPAPMPRLHKLMLLLAVEILVMGFAQAWFNPVRRGILIEVTTTPNHVVT